MEKLPKIKPSWLKVKSNIGKANNEVKELISKLELNTVCESANCPNMGECFSKKTATFMILGNSCTRNCTFCTVSKGTPESVNINEPDNVAKAVEILGLRHVVITSVTRDDLPDGGAYHFANVINSIKDNSKENTPIIEVLIPDFDGNYEVLKTVTDAKPDIINHNIETVPRLYDTVRPMAIYERSLELLNRVKNIDNTIYTKSGIMVGLGETYDEVMDTLQDLIDNHCDILTVGQYLAPSKQHHKVIEYIHPDMFAKYKEQGMDMGFKFVSSGPLVRSSYLAEEAYDTIVAD